MINDKCVFNFGIIFWGVGIVGKNVFNISNVIIKYFEVVYLNCFNFDGFCFMYIVIGDE